MPADQGFQHQQLAPRQLERRAVDAGLAMAEIEGEAAGAEDVGLDSPAGRRNTARSRANNSSTANGFAR